MNDNDTNKHNTNLNESSSSAVRSFIKFMLISTYFKADSVK